MKKLFLSTSLILLMIFSATAQTDPKPLIVVDGEITKIDLKSIPPDSIISVTVLKEKSATDAYGEAGHNGVIIVETRGTKNVKQVKERSVQNALILVNGNEYRGSLESISPFIIESVSVFKDDCAVRKYGEAGKNGVIVVTLKQPVML